MNLRPSSSLFSSLAFLVSSAFFVACTSASTPSAPPPADVASADGSTCTALVDVGSVITLSVEAAEPPTAAGGKIVDGTYVLTSGKVFTGPGGESGAGDERSMTVRVTGSVIEIARTEGGTKGTFVLSGTTIRMTEACPKNRVTELGYTATPTSLELTAPDDDGTFFFSFEKR